MPIANKKLILGAAGILAVVVVFAATRDNSRQTAGQPTVEQLSQQKTAKGGTTKQSERQAKRKKRREAMVKKWNALTTDEQRDAFRRQHPNFRPPKQPPAPSPAG